MKVYIAGKITGLNNYKELFESVEKSLVKQGHAVLNPAVLPSGFTQDEYMHMCYSMIDVCDGVFFLNNWKDSRGAKLEHDYAIEQGKWIKYQRRSL